MSERRLDQNQLQRLLQVGRALVAELDLEVVLSQMLDAARDLTDARYAALGILDDDKTSLSRFLVTGLDDRTRAAIGDLPRGRGVLGELITDPKPLRLARVGDHPHSYGFPPGHPPMSTFLGVPIKIRGEAWGNLYLTDKSGGVEFTEADEELAVVLSEWAAIAIENARLYTSLQHRNEETERAVHALEASAAVARAVGGETDLPRVLELIVKRGRALLDAGLMLVLVRSNSELEVAAAAGEGATRLVGHAIPSDSLPGEVLRTGRTERVSDVTSRVRHGLAGLDPNASVALLTPLVFRGREHGVLMALDRLGDARDFSRDDQLLLESFAASAATAIATARSVESEKLQLSIEASDLERQRWARELHDETLQELAGLKLMLQTARATGDSRVVERALGSAFTQVDEAIQNLQSLITELRPASLDEIGVGAALEALVSRFSATQDLSIDHQTDLDDASDTGRARLDPALETTIYRLVQESLNNVIKHAEGNRVVVRVVEGSERVTVEVSDDGRGFDPGQAPHGFGLVGMKERVGLVGGELEIESTPGQGTTVRASLPVKRVERSEDEAVPEARASEA